MLAVEPRVLFDGAAAVTADVVAAPLAIEARQAAPVDSGVRAVEAVRESALPLVAPVAASQPRQMLVIDTSVPDWQTLASNLPGDVDVLVLDAQRDALSQIAERAQTLGQVSALHVISHGEAGRLSLAGRDIDAAELARSQALLQSIGSHIARDGDILLYGCDVGAGSAGAAFIAQLAQFTQADVAASTNLTGATSQGGDWTLEVSTGRIEAGVVLTEAQREAYQYVLIPGFEPILSVQKGVVRDDVTSGTPTRTFVLDGTATVVAETGDVTTAGTAGNALATVINTSAVAALNTNENNLDGGDTVRYAVVVTNTVAADFMAFDVRLRDALPTGVTLADVSNFRIALGDGTVIYDGTAGTQGNIVRASNGAALADLAETLAAFFNAADGLEFVDPSGVQGILRGANNPDTSLNTSGTNVLVVTYDVHLDASQPAVTQAGKVLTSAATLFNYSDGDGGANILGAGVLNESATISIAEADVAKVVIGTSEAHTTVTDVAVGEEVTYQVTLTIPEGAHQTVIFHDCLDDEQGAPGSGNFLAGMSHLGLLSVTFSAGLNSDMGTDLTTLQANGAITMGAVNGFADRALTINFNNLTNSNSDNTTPETITITYKTLVLNRPGNQENALLLNYADLTIDGTKRDFATDGVRVREPDWSIAVTPDNATHQAGDVVNFTVTVTGANITGFTGTLDAMLANLPANLTYVPGSFQVDGSSTGTGIVANNADMSATIGSLAPGQTAVFTFQATIGAGVSAGQTLTIPAVVRYSSLPNDPDNTGTLSTTLNETTIGGLQQDSERTGAQGVGGALNDYAKTDNGSLLIVAPSAVLTIVQTSEPNTTADAGNSANPGAAENIPAAPGEIVRYRALVQIPQGAGTTDAGIRVALPNGLRFLNDGSIAYALVSDGGLTSSTLAGALADGGTPVNPQDIATLRPSTLLPGSAIVRIAGGGAFASGDDVMFLLGNLGNADSDADGEWVVVEFNAVVTDQVSNQDALTNHRGGAAAGVATQLSTQFDFVSNASAVASTLASSDIDAVTVREPAITDLSKVVLNTTGSVATFEITFSNTGSEEAYNVHLLDDFTAAGNITAGSLSVVSITSAATVTDNSSANALDLAVARLNPGQTVTVRYSVTITDLSLAVAPQQARVTYESVSVAGRSLTASQSGVPVAGVGVSTPGDLRDGASFLDDASAADNYVDQVSAGSGVIAGRVWNDTNNPGNGVLDVWDTAAGGDEPLANVTVRLVWVGPGPAPAGFPIDVLTDADGKYCFSGLPAGNYTVIIPAATLNSPVDGPLKERYESDGTPDRSISVTLPEGSKIDNQDFAYVEINDAPSVTVPSNNLAFSQNNTLCFDGGTGTTGNITHVGLISVADPDNPDPTNQRVTLTSTNGILDVGVSGAANNGVVSGVTVTGDMSASMTLTGTRAAINALLQTLCYTPTTNYNGAAQITIQMDDRGNGGDIAAGNGIPYETVADNLTASQTINLTINPVGVNNPPVANPDTNSIAADALAPATGNAVVSGSAGDVTDTDPDVGAVLQVVGVQAGNVAGPVAGGVGTVITGAHGTVTLNANGTYSYTVNNSNPAVRALNGTQTITDTFTYTINDGQGGNATTTLVITINGRNDPPAGTDKSFPIPEDSPPIPLTPTDFGFSDPDNGDSFKAVRIDTLPSAASGVLALNGVPVTVGQIIPFANIAQLSFTPKPNVNSVSLGGDPGFNFSVCDTNGPVFDPVPNRISFTIAPVNDPPTAPNEVFTVPRDATLATATSKLTAVVGPTDPDLPADTLQIQILSLPPASQGAFYKAGPGGPVLVVVGDLLTPAQLQQLCFVPSATMTGTPNPDGTIPAGTLGYKVTDVTGATANGSISINVPPNQPPVAPDQVFIVNQGAPLNSNQSILNGLTAVNSNAPGVALPSDPDQPVSTLSLAITTLPSAATQGIFYRPNPAGQLVPLQVGDVLTPTQLQQLQFVSATGLTGTPNAQGLINAGVLTYLVSDGHGGTAPGSITINVRPQQSLNPPPLVPPPRPVPPGTSPLPPPPTPTPISINVERGRVERLADEVRLSQLPDNSHFDPFNLLAVKASQMVTDRVDVGAAGKATSAKPQQEVDDCEPAKPKVKMKPKAIKRSLVEDKVGPKVKNFSELLNSEKKRLKPPAKLKPKVAPDKVC